MKKSNSIIAIIGLAIVATAVAFVSCKKETEKALSQKDYTIQQAADVCQIEDINSYLKDFKKKLTESKADEAYNLEDAAWHLASLANLDFCKVNVDYDNVLFDTIEMQVNVTDGVVLLSDLNTVYEQMCKEIQQFKNGFSHNNQNLYFITVSISNDGNAKIELMTTFNCNSKYYWDHTWYFDNDWSAVCSLEQYYSYDSTYYWNTTAARELERLLNLIEHHENDSSNNQIHIYYTPTQSHTFDYTDYDNNNDPYHSGFYNESRVFVMRTTSSVLDYIFSFDDMVYCYDSYLGLGYDFINSSLYPNERPVCWKVAADNKHLNYWYFHYHKLKVNYGRLVADNPIGDM